jgi:hypothetical protein
MGAGTSVSYPASRLSDEGIGPPRTNEEKAKFSRAESTDRGECGPAIGVH